MAKENIIIPPGVSKKRQEGIESPTPTRIKDKPAKGKELDLGTERGKVSPTERCQRMTPRLIDGLEKIATGRKSTRVSAQLRAIEQLLDRAWGKPKETVDTGVTVIFDIEKLTGGRIKRIEPPEILAIEEKNEG